jgi:ribosomal protein S18 acetylase RimI-like enzyme
MNAILEDFTPYVLANAIEANMIAHSADLARSPLVELHREDHLIWCIGTTNYPRFNRVLHARFSEQDLDRKITTALAPFRRRGYTGIWHTGPSTRPENLGERLEDYGLRLAAREPGMAADLRLLPAHLEPVPGLVIEKIAGLDGLRDWCKVNAAAFGLPAETVEGTFAVEATLRAAPVARRQLYLGRLDGEAVACAALFLDSSVAGLYSVGTLSPVRGKGVGSAITIRALREALSMGYRVATLHASSKGESIYRRLGFERYCTLSRYVWAS